MIIIALILHLNGVVDRVVFPVDSCVNSGMYAQVKLAQTGLYQKDDRVGITCRKDG